jgi:cytochrome c-type biogenesis protein CcmH/NrfG
MRKITILTLLVGLLAGFAGVVEAGWEEGVAAFKAGKLDQAVREFQEVTAKQPDFAGGHYMLGQVYLRQGKAQEAVASLRKANELEGKNVAYQYALGTAYLKAGRYADGAEMLKRINPASLPKEQQASYQQALAVALDKTGDSANAADALRKAAQGKPNDADAWFAYGTAAFNAGDTATGVTALDKAVRLDPNDAAKRLALTQALIRLGREKLGAAKQDAYAKAAESGKALVAKSPTYDNLLLLAEADLGAKDYSGAADALTKAAAKNAGAWLPNFYLAQANTSLGKFNEAESNARAALSKATSEADKRRVWGQIGFVNEKLKKFDEAIIAYRNADDAAGAQRVEENKRIAAENQQIEQHNKEIEQIEAERKKLEQELKGLPGGGGGGGNGGGGGHR